MERKILQSTQVTGKTSSDPEVGGGQLTMENPAASNPVPVPQEALVPNIYQEEDILNKFELQRTVTRFAVCM